MGKQVKTAMIFAAGLGTRLKPLTDTMPKALVPYHGTPLLEQVILKLKESGFEKIVINIHHFADMVEEFVRKNDSFGVDILFSDERDLLRDTGGGIKLAEPLLVGDSAEDSSFLVHNVDIVSDLDLAWFYQRHLQETSPDLMASLLVSDRKTTRYFAFDGENRLVGWTNIATGEIKSPFDDFDITHCRLYAFGGIHMLSTKVFNYMKKMPPQFSIVDFYLSMAKRFTIRGVPVCNLHLVDVGKTNQIF